MTTALRKFSTAAAAALLAGAAMACGDARATESEDEFSRDLQLAASTVNLAMPPVDSARLGLENTPSAAPEPAKRVTRGAGTAAVRSATPTVLATPVEELAESEESDVTETMAEAPVVEESLEPVAVAPRPTAPVIPVSVEGGDYGTGTGGGIFGGGGGRGGVVIRGGGVDGDNCELHRTGRGTRGPIYVPRPVATMPALPTTPRIERDRAPRVGMGGARSAGTRRPSASPVGRGATQARPTGGRSPRVGG